MEDLDRFPSREIQVEMTGPPIPQEELYAIFRPYGRIHDIVPGDKVAKIIYTSVRSATAARNCLHAAAHTSHPPNSDPKTTVMRIFYTDKQRASWIKDFAANHPRITIPLLVALLGSLSYFVWDPIRELAVRAKVEGTLDANRWRIVRWVKRETLGRLGFAGGSGDRDAAAAMRTGIEEERQQAKEQLSTWLTDSPGRSQLCSVSTCLLLTHSCSRRYLHHPDRSSRVGQVWSRVRSPRRRQVSLRLRRGFLPPLDKAN